MIDKKIENIKKYLRAANYLSTAQIFLQDNFLMERPLVAEDIKKRLLGHWGTCPGINFIYAHLNYLVQKNKIDMMYVVGPGHGFPAIQSNLFLEGTLSKYYPAITMDLNGIKDIVSKFSWPYGYPSHASPSAPGVILEGGELGYSLSTSYGAVLDNPDLVVTCLIGDGEAETGPIATAWHLNKLLDPATNGAVLPILHLNGYKISGPTMFGRMSDDELQKLFEGYGYKPYFVESDGSQDDESINKLHQEMIDTMEGCYSDIRKIQIDARENGTTPKPKFPMIVLRTPKGWTGIKEIKHKKVEGNHWSHQVVIKDARIDEVEKQALENWLLSYKFEELFDEQNGFINEVLDILPEEKYRIGNSKHAHGGPDVYTPLELPPLEKHAEDVEKPGKEGSSSMIRAGEYLNDIFKMNADSKNFRLFSPDETYSNKLSKVFETTTRTFVWPHEKWDDDMDYGGRVMEMLSEHSLQGLMQGYTLTGRHGIFASYEAFIQIVASMSDQYAKFLKQSLDIPWRGNIPSFNYILTSSGWRQDHNGFSHQNPGFIDNVLQRQGDFINVFFPADGNSTLAVLEHSLSSTNGINVIVAGKTLEPRWVGVEEAKSNLSEGISIWNFASEENPDIVFASAGDYPTKEALAAVDLLKSKLPEIKVRFVNITALSYTGFGICGSVLEKKDFHKYFTEDKPVIFNYHGYPQTIKQILFDYAEDPQRFEVRGYIEEGSTTSPFDMQVRNKTDRFNLVKKAADFLELKGNITVEQKELVKKECEDVLVSHKIYIKKHGVDMPEIEDWKWRR
jgi:xylulose-5-phosphate/fructose-6-phosphate phosphoketolase